MHKIAKFFRVMIVFLCWLPLFFVTSNALAAAKGAQAIVGYWETLDNKTNRPAGILKIWEQSGKYYGKIVHSYTECGGSQTKNTSVGKTILRDLKYQDGVYRDGRILDPRSGDDYRVKVWVVRNGQALKVRGYLGVSLFGKTMVWPRIKDLNRKMQICRKQR